MSAGTLASWVELEPAAPTMVATMRAYLAQIDSVLRPSSVRAANQALRTFATFMTRTHPTVPQSLRCNESTSRTTRSG